MIFLQPPCLTQAALGGVPNDKNFISYFRTSIQIYHKKALVQTGAGMTLIEPKHISHAPAPGITRTHSA